ncbi:hypothetical protein EJ08DRAFT_663220 [Tothia fuscella]|uniref:Uncharacterized protein n=1 Tax=Tothia fuscella TaxID=1048955 RepID=A0A9P4NKZ1_9PEZI|nr:hypothetical protein EJ08DRAFT_663220 [Tothia fuscella]
MTGKFSTAEDAEIIRLKEQRGLGWAALHTAFIANAALSSNRTQGCLQVRYSRYLAVKNGHQCRHDALLVLNQAESNPAGQPTAPPPAAQPVAAPPVAQSAQAAGGKPSRRKTRRQISAQTAQAEITTTTTTTTITCREPLGQSAQTKGRKPRRKVPSAAVSSAAPPFPEAWLAGLQSGAIERPYTGRRLYSWEQQANIKEQSWPCLPSANELKAFREATVNPPREERGSPGTRHLSFPRDNEVFAKQCGMIHWPQAS